MAPRQVCARRRQARKLARPSDRRRRAAQKRGDAQREPPAKKPPVSVGELLAGRVGVACNGLAVHGDLHCEPASFVHLARMPLTAAVIDRAIVTGNHADRITRDQLKPYSIRGLSTRIRLRVASSGAHASSSPSKSLSSGSGSLTPPCGQLLAQTTRSGA